MDVVAQIGIFLGVDYSINRVDGILMFIILAVQLLELQHSLILGHTTHTNHQLYNIIGA